MKKYKIIIVAFVSFIVILTTGVSVLGYSKSFSFNISHSVTGSTNHSLANKRTNAKASGNTYANSGGEQLKKSRYRVELRRPLKTYTNSSNFPADGLTYTRSFGIVTKNDYAVRVTNVDYTEYGDRVKGSGTINQ